MHPLGDGPDRDNSKITNRKNNNGCKTTKKKRKQKMSKIEEFIATLCEMVAANPRGWGSVGRYDDERFDEIYLPWHVSTDCCDERYSVIIHVSNGDAWYTNSHWLEDIYFNVFTDDHKEIITKIMETYDDE